MKRKLFLLLVAVLTSVAAMAQGTKISGKVVDANGEPLLGAGVVVQGTTTGTVTDLDGLFELNVPAGAILEVSSIGYKTVTLPVGNQTKFEITLEDDNEMLEGTVVVGYGTTRRQNFTGSVSTYKVSDTPLANTTTQNALEFLRGTSTGVQLGQSGVAGQTPSMRIRGQKSISGGSEPLIVRDGVIFQGSINDIDPNTIESISVMKDATSLAAYGSQAANGVIMITSKKGQIGKPMINFRGSVGISEQNMHPDLRDGAGYVELIDARRGLPAGDVSWMSPVELARYQAGKETDWYDYVSRKGVQQDYSLNISGATDRMNYMVGAAYNDNTNFIKGNRFTRETVNARVNTTITEWLSAGINLNYTETQNIAPNVFYRNVQMTPWGDPFLSDGVTMRKYADDRTTDSQNPLWGLYNGQENETRGNSINAGGNIEVKIPWVKGLSYRISGNYMKSNSKATSFTHENYYVDLGIGEAAYTPEAFDGHLSEANGSISNIMVVSWVIDNVLNYTRDIGKHYINASLVYTRDSRESSSNGMTGTDFSGVGNTTLGVWGLHNAGTITMNPVTYSLHTDVGYLARVNYSWNNKYHFNASFRRDGSSVFGSEHKWGNFPAVGAAWTITDEPFMKKTSGWLDYLKLKVSWGKNGNQSLSPYGTLSRMNVGRQANVTYFFGDNPAFGQVMTTLGNPNLGWETTTSWNYGFEADLFKRRIHWEVDAYNSKTTDQIFNRQIPVMGTGLTSQSATMGRVDNWGIESSIRANIIQKRDFNWTATLNFTLNRNKLVDLYGDGLDDINNNRFIGEPLNPIYGYRWIGIVQTDDTPYIAANGVQPGSPKFANLDGSEDGRITAADREILGYGQEAFRMSLANTLTWKGWTLYLMFNGVFSGGKYGWAENRYAYVSNDSMQWTNGFNHPFWTEQNRSNTYPSPMVDDERLRALEQYGFVRLQDVNLSYDFRNVGFFKKIGVSSLQLYFSGRNLFFIAPGWHFSDPEVRNPRSQQLARTYTFGLNVRF